MGVDGGSRSLSPPPLAQQSLARRHSSSFSSDAFISRPQTTHDLDQEIDLLLEDLTATCLQRDRSTLIHGSSADTHHFPRRFSKPYRPRFEKNGGGRDTPMSEVTLPELAAYLKVCKPRAFGIKTYRRFYVVMKKTSLHMYKVSVNTPEIKMTLKLINVGFTPPFGDVGRRKARLQFKWRIQV